MAQSVQRLAMGWTVRGPNPVEGEIFSTRPDRPTQPPTKWVSDLFPDGKAAGASI